MNEGTKRTLKRVVDIVIAVLTALITTLSAKAAGIVRKRKGKLKLLEQRVPSSLLEMAES